MSRDRPLLEVTRVAKSFGVNQVLSDVSFSIRSGDSVLLLGANGSGKSTLLRILARLSRADRGSTRSKEGSLGFVGSELQLYPRLTVKENLALFYKAHYRTRIGAEKPQSLADVLDYWDLERYATESVAYLSKGNQWKVALARAFLGCPELVLLDEPTSNLDDTAVDMLFKKLVAVSATRQGASLIASHDIARVSPYVTRVLSLHNGALVADTGSGASKEMVAAHISEYRLRNR